MILTFGKLLSRRAAILRAAFATIYCCIAIPCATIAQDQPADSAQQPLRVNTEIVQLDVSVLAAGGDFVSGLERKNFRVLDGGVEQPLVFFAPTDAPAQILVMVETGPAVYLIQNQHIAAAYALLQGLAPDDQVSLVTYDQVAARGAGLYARKNALRPRLGQIQFSWAWAI